MFNMDLTLSRSEGNEAETHEDSRQKGRWGSVTAVVRNWGAGMKAASSCLRHTSVSYK